MLKEFIKDDYLKEDGTLDMEVVINSLSEGRLLLKTLQELDSDDLKSFFQTNTLKL